MERRPQSGSSTGLKLGTSTRNVSGNSEGQFVNVHLSPAGTQQSGGAAGVQRGCRRSSPAPSTLLYSPVYDLERLLHLQLPSDLSRHVNTSANQQEVYVIDEIINEGPPPPGGPLSPDRTGPLRPHPHVPCDKSNRPAMDSYWTA
ncbi:unnamed protein product [Pleuronectes platessa]|uniref:Uncharacterized protein n=1 Tax=Pleuronectes platessa TaxID=8262 RepID=A0A9N7UHS6_PLEPL|nr:unnamed protein product [Pleuronectes platessa]